MKEKQLELFDKIPKVEKKAIFTLTESRGFIFVDDEVSLTKRLRHHAVIQMDKITKKMYQILLNSSLNFQRVDSKKHDLTIAEYFEIANALKRLEMRINKKTCEVISLSQ
jgi:hypothetical protein